MQLDEPTPKGVKRKAEDVRFPPSPKRIKVFCAEILDLRGAHSSVGP